MRWTLKDNRFWGALLIVATARLSGTFSFVWIVVVESQSSMVNLKGPQGPQGLQGLQGLQGRIQWPISEQKSALSASQT
jgi:hypothetical protein